MTGPPIIVIGASAGGIEALCELVAALPASLAAPILVVVHVPASHPSLLPRILSRRGNLPATHAEDGEAVLPGHIYIAPPDYHVLLEDRHIRLSHGPRENRCRPAVDPLFRSAALAYGHKAIGVVLSGMLDDGTSGLVTIKRHGGTALVQAPEQAKFSSMPRSAIEGDHPDYVLPIFEIAAFLVRLTQSHLNSEDSGLQNGAMKEHHARSI